MPACVLTLLLALPLVAADAAPPDTTALPQAVLAFLYDEPRPFGQVHADAPPETEQFGQLVGVWETVTHAYANERWYSGWPAIWAFKYEIGGFGVQDLWYQSEENLSPPIAEMGRASQLLNTRVYDPTSEQWRVTFISNTAGLIGRPTHGSFDAVHEDGRIVMTPPPVEGEPQRRVVFYDITNDTFRWASEFSSDGGETWATAVRVEGTRIR